MHVQELLQGPQKGNVKIRWMPSHLDEDKAKRKLWAARGVCPSEDDVQGNKGADDFAKLGAEAAAIDSNLLIAADDRTTAARITQDMMVQVWRAHTEPKPVAGRLPEANTDDIDMDAIAHLLHGEKDFDDDDDDELDILGRCDLDGIDIPPGVVVQEVPNKPKATLADRLEYASGAGVAMLLEQDDDVIDYMHEWWRLRSGRPPAGNCVVRTQDEASVRSAQDGRHQAPLEIGSSSGCSGQSSGNGIDQNGTINGTAVATAGEAALGASENADGAVPASRALDDKLVCVFAPDFIWRDEAELAGGTRLPLLDDGDQLTLHHIKSGTFVRDGKSCRAYALSNTYEPIVRWWNQLWWSPRAADQTGPMIRRRSRVSYAELLVDFYNETGRLPAHESHELAIQVEIFRKIISYIATKKGVWMEQARTSFKATFCPGYSNSMQPLIGRSHEWGLTRRPIWTSDRSTRIANAIINLNNIDQESDDFGAKCKVNYKSKECRAAHHTERTLQVVAQLHAEDSAAVAPATDVGRRRPGRVTMKLIGPCVRSCTTTAMRHGSVPHWHRPPCGSIVLSPSDVLCSRCYAAECKATSKMRKRFKLATAMPPEVV